MDSSQDRLELDSRLTELSRVQPWIEAIANQLGLGEEDRFALNLCLEEALANIILHGYQGESGHPIVIQRLDSPESLKITIDDHALPFSPIEFPFQDRIDVTKPPSLESIALGGNGIWLMHRFAGSLRYERLEDGNRLILIFPAKR